MASTVFLHGSFERYQPCRAMSTATPYHPPYVNSSSSIREAQLRPIVWCRLFSKQGLQTEHPLHSSCHCSISLPVQEEIRFPEARVVFLCCFCNGFRSHTIEHMRVLYYSAEFEKGVGWGQVFGLIHE
jgi:hypothetical protein